MKLISEELIKLTENDKSYHSLNGKSILNFPLHVPVGVSIEDFLDDIFRKYRKLLTEQEETICNERLELRQSYKILKKDVEIVCSNILDALYYYKNGKLIKAYNRIKNAVNKGFLQEIEENSKDIVFYRMRGELGKKDEKDFYHIPFDKLYLTDSFRFSMAGFPCLYIGYSEDVCKREIRKDGSMIKLKLKDNSKPLSLIDLTWYESDKEINLFLVSWPLIAACYILPNYCCPNNKICSKVDQKFKEQYVIPQLLSAIIRDKKK